MKLSEFDVAYKKLNALNLSELNELKAFANEHLGSRNSRAKNIRAHMRSQHTYFVSHGDTIVKNGKKFIAKHVKRESEKMPVKAQRGLDILRP